MATGDAILPPLGEFYRGGKVLVTGGSGFLGKVLVEKLLRSCPQLDTIYLLLRTKKGKEPAGRLADITKDVLFDTLRAERPRAFDKLTVVAGDVTERGLGLSDADRQTLQNDVDVVFHSAASVRFDDPLVDAILNNVRGPKEMIDLALGMRKLRSFLHVSTTYCIIDKAVQDEQVYPVAGSWRTMLKLVDNPANFHLLNCIQTKVLGGLPNTYTYTKALGEQVINDYKDKLPLVIVRPSVVLPPKFQPPIGWIDNINGPVALWIAGYVGLIRILLMNPENRIDYVPVDQAINSFIFIACHRALTTYRPGAPLPLYNCCSLFSNRDEQEVIDKGCSFYSASPTAKAICYPRVRAVACQPWYTAQIVLFHLIPYLLMDLFAELAGGKPLLVRSLRRIYWASLAVRVFSVTPTHFINDAFMRLEQQMAPADRPYFWFAKATPMEQDYVGKTLGFLRVHLLKDPLETVPAARKRLRRLFWMEVAFTAAAMLTLVWTVGTSAPAQWLLSAGTRLLV